MGRIVGAGVGGGRSGVGRSVGKAVDSAAGDDVGRVVLAGVAVGEGNAATVEERGVAISPSTPPRRPKNALNTGDRTARTKRTEASGINSKGKRRRRSSRSSGKLRCDRKVAFVPPGLRVPRGDCVITASVGAETVIGRTATLGRAGPPERRLVVRAAAAATCARQKARISSAKARAEG